MSQNFFEVSFTWVLKVVLHVSGVVAPRRSKDGTWTASAPSELAELGLVRTGQARTLQVFLHIFFLSRRLLLIHRRILLHE